MFFWFWAWFLRFFFYVFPEAPVSCDKKIHWINLYYIVLQFVWAQKACPRFLKSYLKLEISTFLFFAVSFFKWICSTKKKVLKENSIFGRSWSSAKLFIMQNYTDNANGYIYAFSSRECVIFLGPVHMEASWPG